MRKIRVFGVPASPRERHVPRPWIPLRLGPFDQENLEFSGCPENQPNSRLRVTVQRLGLALLLRLARETVNESTKPNVWDFHSNAPGVRLPNVFVELRLEAHGESVLENPVGQIDEITGVPNG